MTHSDPTPELLSALVDGELDDLQAARLRRTLRDRPDLAEELRRLEAAAAFVRANAPARAPDDLHARIMARVAAEGDTVPTPIRRFGRPLETLALAAVLLLGVWVALPQTDAPPPATATLAPAEAEPGALLTLPSGYALTTSDERMVSALWRLARELGGQIEDEEGHALLPGRIREDATVYVRLPVEAHPRLQQELERLGAQATSAPDRLVAGMPRVAVEIRLAP